MHGRGWAALTVVLCLSHLPSSHLSAQSGSRAACGTYEYSYPYNTEQLNENHFIVLECSDDDVRGWYYGTSDDFDRGREGYLPGFFVAKMRDIAISESRIQFTIQVADDELFASPVPLTYRSAEQVPSDQLEPWTHGIRPEPRRYEGVIDADSIVLDIEGRERVFARSDTRTTSAARSPRKGGVPAPPITPRLPDIDESHRERHP